MKKIALGIECKLGQDDKLVLIIPPEVSPKKFAKWQQLHRAWVLHRLMKCRDIKTITI